MTHIKTKQPVSAVDAGDRLEKENKPAMSDRQLCRQLEQGQFHLILMHQTTTAIT
jgi:hypothetical protein